MPRNRSVRLAVLGSTVQRTAAPKYALRNGPAMKRRLVVGLFVVLSLLLITIYFREPPTGGLHTLQGAGATVLHPFQVGAERVARPFRDVYGYFSGVLGAKEENERLRAELIELRQRAIQNQTARQQVVELQRLLNYNAAPGYPTGFDPVAATVIAVAPTQFNQRVTISAGSNAGVAVGDPVVDGNGLVGIVADVTPSTAKVVLLTDQSSAVSGLDNHPNSGATGLVQAGSPGSGSLVFNRVGKDDVVEEGDELVTAGSQRGDLGSLYPRGIPIGRVTFVSQSDTDTFKRIQVEPFVDFDSLQSVIVLVPTGAAR